MKDILIEGSHDSYFTPYVHFSASTGRCKIMGESYLEESFEFYDRLIGWIHEYFANGNKSLELTIKLTYFNTSSSRCLTDMMRVLKSYQDKGYDVNVVWMYPTPDDDDIKQEGIDMQDETKIKMEFIEYRAD
ncbi:MAG: DUF1987 domain-containing protein [Cytophagales bacterium]|nr:DUF1987 domain-containing protein [Cytophagales bacterium]MDW8384908.1 DUF1987 domain-containing protein [Flammeovirgaceae bacterium]